MTVILKRTRWRRRCQSIRGLIEKKRLILWGCYAQLTAPLWFNDCGGIRHNLLYNLPEDDPRRFSDFDVFGILNRAVMETKGKDRTTLLRPYFEASVPCNTYEYEIPNFYSFFSAKREPNGGQRYDLVQMAGWCTRKEFDEHKYQVRAGRQDNGCNMPVDVYNILIEHLREPMDFSAEMIDRLLLDSLPNDDIEKLRRRRVVGGTVLPEDVVRGDIIPVVKTPAQVETSGSLWDE